MIRLRFCGAAREVTGSMHVLEVDGHAMSLDCGLFQGRREESNRRNRSFACDPEKIKAVILSHAHIDHIGRLPRLVRSGFEGPIYGTPATCDLARILLADSAHIQEEDVAYWNKKRVHRGDMPIEPLYTAEDAQKTVRRLQSKRLKTPFDVTDRVQASLHEAGHMLGSAGMTLTVRENGQNVTRIAYTGDLGRPGIPILRDPAPLPQCDYLICESTYGGRRTPTSDGMAQQLADVINDTVDRGGKIVIPAFAVGRTQVIVYYYHMLLHQGRIRRRVPLIVDSPLAIWATKVFQDHPETYDYEAMRFNHVVGDIFQCGGCEYTRSVEDSKALHRRNEPMIIISASGMCEVGRILHHLKNNITNSKNTILIVGYQAENTLGRRLVERHKQVRIFGDLYDVNAQVKVLNGFSAHANADELAHMTSPLADNVRRAFVVHGEMDQAGALATTMRDQGFKDVVIPGRDETVTLDD